MSRSSSLPTPKGGGRAPLVQDGYDLRGDFFSSFHDSLAPPTTPQNYTKTLEKSFSRRSILTQTIASAPCPHLYPSNVVQILNRWSQITPIAQHYLEPNTIVGLSGRSRQVQMKAFFTGRTRGPQRPTGYQRIGRGRGGQNRQDDSIEKGQCQFG